MRNATRHLFGAALIAATVGFAGCSSTMPMSHSKMQASNEMTGAQEVPPNSSGGTGMVTTSLDKGTRMLHWKITYSGLTGPVKAGHFHGPAGPGSNAGVVVPFTGSLASPIEGSATLTDAQMADLLAGRWYANLHTAAHPGGEIRAQITGL